MGIIRGFKLGRKFIKVIGSLTSRRARNQRLGTSNCTTRTVAKLCRWGRSLRRGATGLCLGKWNLSYVRVGQEPDEQSKPSSVPKGYLAVYVGEEKNGACRVVLPVIYFNHPLFANLLREAEKIYGFDHQGGIKIPCQKSEFEDVKMRIAAASGGGIRQRRRRSSKHMLVDLS